MLPHENLSPFLRVAVVAGVFLLSAGPGSTHLRAIDATLTDDASTFANKPGKNTGAKAALNVRMVEEIFRAGVLV